MCRVRACMFALFSLCDSYDLLFAMIEFVNNIM